LKFHHKKNPEEAHFIDKQFYLDSSIFEKSIEKIFRTNPIYIGHLSSLNSDSNLIPKSIYPNLLDKEIILKFDLGKLSQILSNVCTHRAHLLLDKKCSKQTIQCPYHGRTFTNTGKLKNAPGFDGKLDYLKTHENLSEYSFLNFGNFYFLTFQKHHLKDIIGNFHKKLDWYPFDKLQPDENFVQEFTINAHWALYVENYLEGFHIPYIHKGLAQEINLQDYNVEILPKGTLQTANGKTNENTFSQFGNVTVEYTNLAAIYLWIYPNIMLNIYPWGVSVNIIIPQHKEKTIIRYETFVFNSENKKSGAGGDLGTVEMEDQNAILKVQKGLKSSTYNPGRISTEHELGVHHFHQLIFQDFNS